MKTKLYLSECPELVVNNLPDNMEIRGNLDMEYCRVAQLGRNEPSNSLTKLPKNMKVSGNMNLEFCEELKSLPEGLKVGGELNLTHCQSLESIESLTKVGGKLICRECDNLFKIRDGLKIGGDFDLTTCKLETLPSKLIVQKDLSLAGYGWSVKVPKDIDVRGNINILWSGFKVEDFPERLRHKLIYIG